MIEEAIVDMAGRVYDNIDMTKHQGGHPRMGALDVVPFVPISDVTMEECIDLANRVGKSIGEKYKVPVYLYEDAATSPERQNLANVRKGQYEGFFEKINDSKWTPNYGPLEMNAKGGCVAIGARVPLVAFNVNLATSDIEVADKIAKMVRHIGGGLRFVKAMGVTLEDRNIVQISMNLVNYEKTAVYRAFEMVKMEAKRYGVSVIGSEVIGLLPMAALIQSAEYYLQIENFSMNQILEKRIAE
jgi:glutamate formiminotransferase